MMNRPIAIDLFSGCGGMSLGLEAAGFNIAAAVEIDPIHGLVHHVNFPYTATICRDIRQLKTIDLMKAIQEKGFKTDIDLIAGGSPCQGFSQIGKRQLDDPRNSLVFHYLRIIKDLQPKYFLFENVPGMASGKHKQFLEELIYEFEKIGYHIEQPVKILDASLFGAPQKRKRLIILGSRKDVEKVSYPNETHDLLNFNNVGDAISDLKYFPAFLQKDQGINSQNLDYQGFRINFAIQPNGFYSLCHTRPNNNLVYGHLGSNHTEKSRHRFSITKQGKIETKSRFLRLDAQGLCNTLRAGTASDKGAYTAPRPIHYKIPRCITIREAARLHTFPDWFQFHRTIWHGFREIGNAVIPLLAKRLGDEIINALDIDINTLDSLKLDPVDNIYLSYNMGQASAYWDVPPDTIPKRKRLKKDQ
ncbi:MAG: DNA cytosine methyltransferase [Microcystaceae cyanobacterium]